MNNEQVRALQEHIFQMVTQQNVSRTEVIEEAAQKLVPEGYKVTAVRLGSEVILYVSLPMVAITVPMVRE